ncbi:unnamed protein product [Macrosiphum euphorbiae]|uniref:HAT C-terminal dimerisation domain-containing protein n=1 Tax=Macrosiphum euphorbiae TaxID=13131 RepID=A0AAV0VSL9_9HEMI|nr:unnamed protein product [Macrosiphum euphorbiae]
MLEGIIEVPRTVGRQTARNNIPSDSPEQYYKRSIFLPFLDHFICQLQDRFTNHHHVMAKLQSLIPNFIKNTTDIKYFQEVALFYKDILPNYETFDAEIKIWLTKWKNVSDRDRPTTSFTTLSAMSYDFFPNIHSLLTIMATLPVTTATAKRSFSTLRRLKTYLRNNMGETRLTGLALLNIYQNVDLNVEKIIDRFAMLPRKWDFIL